MPKTVQSKRVITSTSYFKCLIIGSLITWLIMIKNTTGNFSKEIFERTVCTYVENNIFQYYSVMPSRCSLSSVMSTSFLSAGANFYISIFITS